MKTEDRVFIAALVLMFGFFTWAIISTAATGMDDTTRRCLIGTEIIDCGEVK